jgi:hypothetical protein
VRLAGNAFNITFPVARDYRASTEGLHLKNVTPLCGSERSDINLALPVKYGTVLCKHDKLFPHLDRLTILGEKRTRCIKPKEGVVRPFEGTHWHNTCGSQIIERAGIDHHWSGPCQATPLHITIVRARIVEALRRIPFDESRQAIARACSNRNLHKILKLVTSIKKRKVQVHEHADGCCLSAYDMPEWRARD